MLENKAFFMYNGKIFRNKKMLEFFFGFATTPETIFEKPTIDEPTQNIAIKVNAPTIQERAILLDDLAPSDIPLQIPQHDPLFQEDRKKAEANIITHFGQCAKFLNRLFYYRYNKQVFGNAWDLQLHPDNKEFLTLSWQIPQDSFKRAGLLRLKDRTERMTHIKSLYEFLDSQENPTGALGSVYRFSGYREEIASNSKVLAQTHISLVSNKQLFSFTNTKDTPQTLEEIITTQYGPMRDFEKEYFNTKLPLNLLIQPGKKYTFSDYLVEEEIFGVQAESLLQVFLRKEIRNGIDYPQLRPNSFSTLSSSLQEELQYQEELFDILGPVEFIPGSEWETTPIKEKNTWQKILLKSFQIEDPSKEIAIPIPTKR